MQGFIWGERNWPISCQNDSETQDRGLKAVKFQKHAGEHACGPPYKLAPSVFVRKSISIILSRTCTWESSKNKYACMKLDIIKLNFLKETYSILSTLSEQIVHTWLCFGSNIKSLYTATPLTNFTPISASIGHLNVVYCKHLSTLGDFHPINFSWGLCIGIQFFWQCNVV